MTDLHSEPGSRLFTAFVCQDGVMLCSTLRALDRIGLLRPSLAADRGVDELLGDTSASGYGYLRVGLRCLASQGWLAGEPTLDPQTTVLVIRELMLGEVLPEMQRQPGATALGLNVQWTLGKQAMV